MGFFKRKSKKNKKNKESSEVAESTASTTTDIDPEFSVVKENTDEDTSAETPNSDIAVKDDFGESEDMILSKDDDDDDEPPSPSAPQEPIDPPTDDEILVEQDFSEDEDEEEKDRVIDRQNTAESFDDEKLDTLADKYVGEDLKTMSKDEEDVDRSQRPWGDRSTNESTHHNERGNEKQAVEKGDESVRDEEKRATDGESEAEDLNYSMSSKSFRGFMNRITSSKADDDEPLTIFGIRCGAKCD